MNLEILQSVLGWCVVMNMGLLFIWFLIVTVAGDFIYKFHSRWYPMSRETFSAIHYTGIAYSKMLVFVFNVVPYIALLIVTSN